MGWSQPLTHRQYLVWQSWLELEWDKPSRADWYSIQVAAETRRGYLLNAQLDINQVKEANMKLVFTRPQPTIEDIANDSETILDWEMNVSKAAALARRGAVVKEAPMPVLAPGEEPYIEEQPDWTVK